MVRARVWVGGRIRGGGKVRGGGRVRGRGRAMGGYQPESSAPTSSERFCPW